MKEWVASEWANIFTKILILTVSHQQSCNILVADVHATKQTDGVKTSCLA